MTNFLQMDLMGNRWWLNERGEFVMGGANGVPFRVPDYAPGSSSYMKINSDGTCLCMSPAQVIADIGVYGLIYPALNWHETGTDGQVKNNNQEVTLAPSMTIPANTTQPPSFTQFIASGTLQTLGAVSGTMRGYIGATKIFQLSLGSVNIGTPLPWNISGLVYISDVVGPANLFTDLTWFLDTSVKKLDLTPQESSIDFGQTHSLTLTWQWGGLGLGNIFEIKRAFAVRFGPGIQG